MALGGSWALLGGFRPPPELQSGPWEAPGGSRGKGFGPRRAPGGPENRKNMILEMWAFSPKRSRPYEYTGFRVFLKKLFFFFEMGPVGFSGSAREGPERCGQRPKDFQGGPRESGSGPRGPFWRVLDRQKFARAQFVMDKVGGF